MCVKIFNLILETKLFLHFYKRTNRFSLFVFYTDKITAGSQLTNIQFEFLLKYFRNFCRVDYYSLCVVNINH